MTEITLLAPSLGFAACPHFCSAAIDDLSPTMRMPSPELHSVICDVLQPTEAPLRATTGVSRALGGAASLADYLVVKGHDLGNSQTASIWQKVSG